MRQYAGWPGSSRARPRDADERGDERAHREPARQRRDTITPGSPGYAAPAVSPTAGQCLQRRARRRARISAGRQHEGEEERDQHAADDARAGMQHAVGRDHRGDQRRRRRWPGPAQSPSKSPAPAAASAPRTKTPTRPAGPSEPSTLLPNSQRKSTLTASWTKPAVRTPASTAATGHGSSAKSGLPARDREPDQDRDQNQRRNRRARALDVVLEREQLAAKPRWRPGARRGARGLMGETRAKERHGKRVQARRPRGVELPRPDREGKDPAPPDQANRDRGTGGRGVGRGSALRRSHATTTGKETTRRPSALRRAD